MSKQIEKDLIELIDQGIISKEVAENIRNYYSSQSQGNSRRLLTIFGIFGAALVGLGIILILAHNWDQLSRLVKTIIAFLPLVVGQALCGYALFNKKSANWLEGTSVFLVMAIGASISLISQIYNIPGNISEFMLTWTLLSLPLVYLMHSSATALLVLVGATYYAADLGYWEFPNAIPFLYLIPLAALLPHYYKISRNNPQGNFAVYHHWLIPLSLTIALGTFASEFEELMFVGYFALFVLFTLTGSKLLPDTGLLLNGYRVTGILGMLTILLMLSFKWFWQEFNGNFNWSAAAFSLEMVISVFLSILVVVWIIRNLKVNKTNSPENYLMLAFVPTFVAGYFIPILPLILFNIMIFWWGLFNIRRGARRNHLGILNYGLLIITVLVISRFFDTNLSFVLRGILFLLVGSGFFLGNYLIIRKKEQIKSQI